MLTETEKENLLLAIERAKDSGACQYAKDGEPCCVIGQYAYLTGVPIEVLEDWDHLGTNGSSANVAQLIRDNTFRPGLSPEFLYSIQRVWDVGEGTDEELREKMRSKVEKAYGEI